MTFFARIQPLLLLAVTATALAQEPAPAPAVPLQPFSPAPPAAEATPTDEPVVPRAEPAIERDITTRAQIFLDQKLFGPGKIDGRPGEFFTKALIRYQRAHGLPETGKVGPELPLNEVFPVYLEYSIRAEDMKFVGNTPSKTSEQAQKKYLPYNDLLEFLTEKFHCAPEFLQKINPGVKLEGLKAGAVIRVPNVQPFNIEELPKQGNLPDQPQFQGRKIKISRKERMLELYEGESMLAALPLTPGVPGGGAKETPAGKWKIVGIAANPTFRWDEGVLNHGKRTDTAFNLPSGPNNPVGICWIGLNRPGIGIHGTNNPQTIGRAQSHGCMRTANWDVMRLAKMVTKGVAVEIE